MHTSVTIGKVRDSIGWAAPVRPISGITISAENLLSNSGRYFNSFHELAVVENVYETYGTAVPLNDELNTGLLNFKTQAALETLSKIFDSDPQYDPLKDYEGTVVKYIGVIQEVYGLVTCVQTLQMMLNSTRINATERKAKYSMLKIELEGFRNEQGVLVSVGLNSRVKSAVNKAKEIIFPNPITVYGDDEW